MKRKILSWFLWTTGWSLVVVLFYLLYLQFLIISQGSMGYAPLGIMEGLDKYIPFSGYIAYPFIRFFMMFALGERFYECVYLAVTTVYVKLVIDLIIFIYRKYKNRKIVNL